MNIENVTNLYQLYDDDGIIISYHGTFLQEMIEEISIIINNQITSHSDLKLDGRYLGLFVELAQNILKYSAKTIIKDDGKQMSNGLILVGVRDGKIFVISGNPVTIEHEKALKVRLDRLKDCSKEDLNRAFKDQLKRENDNVLSRGAGLGLIDITRKSDNLEYHFSKLDSGSTFFTLKVEYNI
jgi:hypothetical protein